MKREPAQGSATSAHQLKSTAARHRHAHGAGAEPQRVREALKGGFGDLDHSALVKVLDGD